jgi:opacity protein-like surface antigen
MVVSYVKVPAPTDSAEKDSIPMEVVQRTYSDDSTYTAYVSGIKYQDLPKLDSIITRQRQVTNTITKTITIQKKPKRWHIGLQAGYGYGLVSRQLEPYVGAGVGYSW